MSRRRWIWVDGRGLVPELALLLLLPPLIALLLATRGPSAIVRGVVAIVILAVKRQSKRPRAHVGKEIMKYFPSFAHGDSATAVVLPLFRGVVKATLSHVLPRVICRGTRLTEFCMPVIFPGASARSDVPIPKFCPYHYYCGPAFADGIPCNEFSFVRRLGQNGKFPVLVPNFVF